MADWNAAQYLKFEKERTQPAVDLAARAKKYRPKTIVDIGCGPGNSTNVLKQVFPNAKIVGIDRSPGMIKKATAQYPGLEFKVCEATALTDEYDMLFSNACFQWIPKHGTLLPALAQRLPAGGVLAVQMPINGEEPLFRQIKEIAADPKWGFQNVTIEPNETLSPGEYYNILSGCFSAFEMWETTYYHALPDHRALIEWVKGTRIRPYLAVLDEKQGIAFENEILTKVKESYPIMKNGQVILRFRRLFFIAEK